ncbi:bifunctional diaminohydroxyphosphoribosylaminopyrimidine deaminase/5-amino-6-(5-phosphoribosylamino)uracil reductase RibD [Halocynthiibacter sp.]|uniref:bifunctional diaminohydroxyphosphoribosylaminopyrimidine deaminase/5-amino-6-(5-phosphoribosylamino)uracil reductase RibD n=1 Tax=Halocynthiibacter sp. TaxID=1979210 RepID=UPI003C4B6594
MSSDDLRHMTHALGLARRGLGRVWPNPSVGCVIVKDGLVVGRGRTAPGGRPHGEPQALAMAGEAARGATVYVTLEPCAHTGKTPPCAQALIDAGVARVVSALADDDPRVAGGGHQMLRDAGVSVETGLCARAARTINEGFFHRVNLGRPMLTLKLASSFDGRIATASGESQWITGPAARRNVHMERACHDGVLVGAGTARADDPSLNVRGLGIKHQPVRIIATRMLDIPLTGKLAQTARDIPVWLIHGPSALPERRAAWEGCGAKLIEVPEENGTVSPAAMLQALGAEGMTRIYCEGGGSLAAALLRADLADHISGYTAGVMLGAEGLASLAPMGLETLAEAPRFTLKDIRRLGPDVLHRWQRSTSE